MKRAVICTLDPQNYISQLADYSIMIINPESKLDRYNYLLEKSDWSVLITEQGTMYRNGNDYPNEKILMFTSGTTGDSKFYSFSQEKINTMAKNNISAYNITENDRYASVMPLWHAHGQSFYWTMKYANCEIEYFPSKQLKLVPKYAPTFTTAVPAILRVLNKFKFNTLRFVASAGAALTDNLYRELTSTLQVPIIEAFGMTENISHCFTNPLYGEQRIGTVGLPFGVTTYIDENKHLYIKGPSVVVDGWLDTGDLAIQDEKGYYRILGRSVDQINVKGIKLNPASIETQLKNNITGITDCVIFGTNWVNCMYVGDAPVDTIQKFLLSLGPYCKAKNIINVTEIPLNNSGKISRSFLNTTLS